MTQENVKTKINQIIYLLDLIDEKELSEYHTELTQRVRQIDYDDYYLSYGILGHIYAFKTALIRARISARMDSVGSTKGIRKP